MRHSLMTGPRFRNRTLEKASRLFDFPNAICLLLDDDPIPQHHADDQRAKFATINGSNYVLYPMP